MTNIDKIKISKNTLYGFVLSIFIQFLHKKKMNKNHKKHGTHYKIFKISYYSAVDFRFFYEKIRSLLQYENN